MPNTVTVIGVGNELRGDDASGLLLARRIADQDLDGVCVLEHSGEGVSLMESWQGCQAVLLIDAVQSGKNPGSLHRFDAAQEPINAKALRCSTHNFSVPEAIEMSRALETLPKRFLILGIEGKSFDAGSTLSPEVEDALESATHAVVSEIQMLQEASCTNNP